MMPDSRTGSIDRRGPSPAARAPFSLAPHCARPASAGFARHKSAHTHTGRLACSAAPAIPGSQKICNSPSPHTSEIEFESVINGMINHEKISSARGTASGVIAREPDSAELPACGGREEISVACAYMRRGRDARATAQHVLVGHELAVVFAHRAGRSPVSRIWLV
jgi:hypothetical protein